ncbi:MAG: hypothetical protein IJX63_05945 [Lachnospiraceae bacterium]|nr:hypothetical protein [Lachnospiraceae bacterium]
MELTVKVTEDVLYDLLNRGMEDMGNGRELPLEEAFEKITELRNETI